jgi:hypothetical protein
MPQSNATAQQPVNQNAGAGQNGNPSGNEPATTGRGGDRSQQPASGQGSSGSDTSGQPTDRNPQQGKPNAGNK